MDKTKQFKHTSHEPRIHAMPHFLLSAFVIPHNSKYTWLSVLSVFSSL